MDSAEWTVQKMEITSHLRKLFRIYGEDEGFLDEYLAGVLEFDIEKSLECFRNLIKVVQVLKPKEWENEQRLQGMHSQLPKYESPRKFKPYVRRRKNAVSGKLQEAGRTYADRRSGTA